MNRRATVVATLAAALLLATAGVARADKEVQAQPTNAYSASTVTMDQGEPLRFRNLDINSHSVTATQKEADGKPVFNTPVIGSNQSAFVEGSQYLTTGSYPFFCTVHPFMTATLVVTSAGTPQPRPAPDTTPPTLSVKLRDKQVDKVLDAGKLRVSATVDEAADVTVKAKLRSGGKTVKVASGKASAPGAGAVKVSLKLTSSARRALKRESKPRIKLSATARDAAGNSRDASGSKTLKS